MPRCPDWLPFVLAPGLWRTLRTLGTRPLAPNPNSYRWTAYPRGTISCSGLLLIAGILLAQRGLELAQGLIRGIFA
ncbi:hypothetical protein [Bilophila wadsworthia]|uniref:hypothetical protein n=1 Tax=Bilophila wadsworthia TaxID=35833 RepID=UPI003522B1A3